MSENMNEKMRESLTREFPEALPVKEVADKSYEILKLEGYTAENTLLATCLCRDEINCDAVRAFSDIWGENFRLAGLAGYPSAGKTGMTAYSHHVPDNGHHLIFFGPHIGISEAGELGVVRRKEMNKDSTSCGALCLALSKIKDGNRSFEIDPLDVEQSLVENGLSKKVGAADTSLLNLKEVTLQMASLIHETVKDLRSGIEGDNSFAFIGGVLINTPTGHSDYFQPLWFEADTSSGGQRSEKNLMSSL